MRLGPVPAITVDFTDMTSVDVKTASLPVNSKGTSTITVQGTPANAATEVETGQGTNQVTVQPLTTVLGPLTFTSMVGALNSLTVDDSAATTPGTYTLTTDSLQDNGSALVQFAGFMSVSLAPAKGQNDAVNVPSTAAGVAYTINGSVQTAGGTDQVHVGDANDTLAEILGPVSVMGGQGHTSLRIADDGSSTSNTYTVSSSAVLPSDAAAINYTGLSALTLAGGGGGNEFLLSGTAMGTATTLDAGAGADTVVVGGKTSSYAGALTIDGQGGVNTLSYAAVIGPVTVDLALGVATAVSGGIRNIQDLIGGPGNDLFVGNGQANVLTGGTGRNILIAGAGRGTLIGNTNQDLLVGGTTVYDSNLTVLDAVMAEWASAASYTVRVPLILNGGGLNGKYHLGAADFTSNRGGNTLTGGPGVDLFYGNKVLDTNDWNPSLGEVFVTNNTAKGTPMVQVIASGSTYSGQPAPVTATVTGVNGVPAATLEGVGLTLKYSQILANATSQPLNAAPTAAGSYSVVASFSGSADYLPASSQPAPFTIARATPTLQVNAPTATYNGQPVQASATVAGVVAGVDNTPVPDARGRWADVPVLRTVTGRLVR